MALDATDVDRSCPTESLAPLRGQRHQCGASVVWVGESLDQLGRGELDDRAEIDPQLAEQYVEQYLDGIGARDDYPGLVCDVELVGERAVVEISAPLTLPFSPPGWDDSTIVTGEASAVVPVT